MLIFETLYCHKLIPDFSIDFFWTTCITFPIQFIELAFQ